MLVNLENLNLSFFNRFGPYTLYVRVTNNLDLTPLDDSEWSSFDGFIYECRNAPWNKPKPCGFRWFANNAGDTTCPRCGLKKTGLTVIAAT